MRVPNTTAEGRSFSKSVIDAVWEKASGVGDYDRDVWRRDKWGALIKRSDYGNTNSKFGWEIDHNRPIAKGGTDALINLEPLQWENNRRKGDDWPIREYSVKG